VVCFDFAIPILLRWMLGAMNFREQDGIGI